MKKYPSLTEYVEKNYPNTPPGEIPLKAIREHFDLWVAAIEKEVK